MSYCFCRSKETINDYQLEEEQIITTTGTIRKATRIKDQKRYWIKTISNTPSHEAPIDNEKNAYKSIRHDNIAHLECIFSDDQNMYFVYKNFTGVQLVSLDRKFSIEEAAKIAIQFINALDVIHMNGWKLCSEYIDNLFITEESKLYILGLGSVATSLKYSPSYLWQLDNPIDNETDVITIGILLHFLLTGVSPFLKETNSFHISDELDPVLNEFLSKCCCSSKLERSSMDIRNQLLIHTNSNYYRALKNVEAEEFYVSWSNDIYFGIGGTNITIDKKKSGFNLSSSFKDGDDIENVQETPAKFEIHDKSISYVDSNSSIKFNNDEFKFSFQDKVTGQQYYLLIDENGITVKNNTSKLVASRDIKLTINNEMVVLDNEGLHDNDVPGVNLSVGKDEAKLSVGDFSIIFEETRFRANLLKNQLVLLATKEFMMHFGPFVISLKEGQINIRGCAIAISLSNDKLKLKCGGVVCSMSPSKFRMKGEGFDFKINDTCILGYHGQKIDISDIKDEQFRLNITFPVFPKYIIPAVPPLPVLPEKNLIEVAPVQKKEFNSIDDHLKIGETIKLESSIVKTRYILSKKERKIVLTSKNRIFYTTPDCTEIKGEIKLGMNSVVEKRKSTGLVVTSNKGKIYDLDFPNHDRDEWELEIKQIIESFH